MIKNMYAILDIKAETYTDPMPDHTDGLAIRKFKDEAKRADSMLNKHPEDYKLYNIGYYDTANGKLHTNDFPVLISELSTRDTQNGESTNEIGNETPIQPNT
jgi:hypothetical protein